ncbi:MAG: phosphoribosyltransferase [Anaerolineales bacterium]|nr:phosphoribosyltransferase [Anaerolineales bacterium]
MENNNKKTKSYDYQNRRGVEKISWSQFVQLYETLVELLEKENLDLIVGVARAGLFPATAISCALRKELYPVRITRRINDVVQSERPVWRVDIPATVAGQRVAVIDEIADSGETLAMVASRAWERGASHVVTASLVSHSWANPKPEYTALTSDALVLFPWDQRVYIDQTWQVHPEILSALKNQEIRKSQ